MIPWWGFCVRPRGQLRPHPPSSLRTHAQGPCFLLETLRRWRCRSALKLMCAKDCPERVYISTVCKANMSTVYALLPLPRAAAHSDCTAHVRTYVRLALTHAHTRSLPYFIRLFLIERDKKLKITWTEILVRHDIKTMRHFFMSKNKIQWWHGDV